MVSKNYDDMLSKAVTSVKIWLRFYKNGKKYSETQLNQEKKRTSIDYHYYHYYYKHRVESEQLYSKSLSKMASKLNKACREVPGTLADAWRNVAAEMESRSEVHRQFSTTMTDEIVKPLKQLLDNQHKTRKSVNFHSSSFLYA